MYRPLTPQQRLAIDSGEVNYSCEVPGPVCIMRDADGREGRGNDPREAFDQLEVARLEALLSL
jgi:hypothetical protein